MPLDSLNLDPITGLPMDSNPVPTTKNTSLNLDPITGEQMQGGVMLGSSAGYINKYEEQKRLGVDNISTANNDNYNMLLSNAQPWYEQMYESGKMLGGGFIGGGLQALGASLEIPNIGDIVSANELEYSNSLMDLGKDIIEATHGNIYEQTPGEVNFSDPGWWFRSLGSQGVTLGIAAEALLEVAAVTALTEGMGTGAVLANIGNKFKAARGLQATLNMANTASRAQKFKSSATKWAVFRRYNESVIEAKDSFDERLEYYQGIGMNDKEARENASIAAATTFKANIPLVVLDILQAQLMTFNPVTGAGTSKVDDALMAVFKNKIAARGSALIGSAGLEGTEELWQYIGQEEGKYNADRASGLINSKTAEERYGKYITDPGAWDAFASGVMGGILLGGGGQVLSSYQNQEINKTLAEQSTAFTNGIGEVTLELTKKFNEARKNGDVIGMQKIQREFGLQRTKSALELDSAKGGTANFEAQMSFYNSILDAIEENNTEILTQQGIDDSNKADTKATLESFVKDAIEFKELYDQYADTEAPGYAGPIAYRAFIVNKSNEALPKQKALVELERSKLKNLEGLSHTAQQEFSLNAEITSAEQTRDYLQSQITEGAISEEQKEVYESQIKSLDRRIIGFKSSLSQLSELDDRTEDVKASDRELMKSVPDVSKFQKHNNARMKLENDIAINTKELNKLKNKRFQSADSEGKTLIHIEQSDSKEELEAYNQALNIEEKGSKRVKDAYNNKKQSLISRTERLLIEQKAAKKESERIDSQIAQLQESIKNLEKAELSNNDLNLDNSRTKKKKHILNKKIKSLEKKKSKLQIETEQKKTKIGRETYEERVKASDELPSNRRDSYIEESLSKYLDGIPSTTEELQKLVNTEKSNLESLQALLLDARERGESQIVIESHETEVTLGHKKLEIAEFYLNAISTIEAKGLPTIEEHKQRKSEIYDAFDDWVINDIINNYPKIHSELLKLEMELKSNNKLNATQIAEKKARLKYVLANYKEIAEEDFNNNETITTEVEFTKSLRTFKVGDNSYYIFHDNAIDAVIMEKDGITPISVEVKDKQGKDVTINDTNTVHEILFHILTKKNTKSKLDSFVEPKINSTFTERTTAKLNNLRKTKVIKQELYELYRILEEFQSILENNTQAYITEIGLTAKEASQTKDIKELKSAISDVKRKISYRNKRLKTLKVEQGTTKDITKDETAKQKDTVQKSSTQPSSTIESTTEGEISETEEQIDDAGVEQKEFITDKEYDSFITYNALGVNQFKIFKYIAEKNETNSELTEREQNVYENFKNEIDDIELNSDDVIMDIFSDEQSTIEETLPKTEETLEENYINILKDLENRGLITTKDCY